MKTRNFMAFAAAAVISMASCSQAFAAENKTMAPTSEENTFSADSNNKYEYKYDEEGRVTTRIHYGYNTKAKEWRPLSCYTVFYGPEETILTYAKYNAGTRLFNLKPEQKRFKASEYPILIKSPNQQ